MKTIKLPLITLLSISLLFTACEKETSSPIALTSKSKTELLCSGKWQKKSFTINPGIDIGGGVIITDWYTQIGECSIDDTEKYETNGTGIFDEEANNCDPNGPQTYSFNWSFKDNETILITADDDAKIINLTETDLVIELNYDGVFVGGIPGINYKLTIGYKH